MCSRILFGIAFALGLAVSSSAGAEAFYSRSEALELAFPGADRVESKTVVLNEAQARAVESLARAPLDSKLVTWYRGFEGDRVIGYAFIQIHTVRTLPAALLVVMSPEGGVRSLRMLAFYEPPEYLPSERWLAQFNDRELDEEMRLQRKIHGIAGATLSAQTITSGVRRALALYQVVFREPSDTHVSAGPKDG